MLIEPLLTIEPIPGVALPLEGVQAIVLTSANAVAALTPTVRDLPVFAVGKATAEQARRQGCPRVEAAEGDAAHLARLVADRLRPTDGALLHLCGTEVRAGLAEGLGAAGFEVRRQAVYRAVAATRLSPAVSEAMRQGALDAILLFSPRTAQILVDLITRQRLRDALRATVAICLSAAVAEPCAVLFWRAIHTAVRPEQGAVVEALEAAGRRW